MVNNVFDCFIIIFQTFLENRFLMNSLHFTYFKVMKKHQLKNTTIAEFHQLFHWKSIEVSVNLQRLHLFHGQWLAFEVAVKIICQICTHFISLMLKHAATFRLRFKILVKLNIFTTYLVDCLSVEVKWVDHGFGINEASSSEHQVLQELIFVVEVQVLNDLWIEEIFGKFWNLERIKFIFD